MIMLAKEAAEESPALKDTQRVTGKADSVLGRKIWLPRVLYAALPYFYFFSGAVALLATLYISDWFWILPHYALFSAACLHLGIFVYRRRRRDSA